MATIKYQIIVNILICKVFQTGICCLSVLQSLCCEIKQRRRGVASVLRLCQHLLDDQETCNLNADHQSMQLIIVNLERRWEAIVMQAVQWQTRLQKRLEKDSVSVACFKKISCSFILPKRHFSSAWQTFISECFLLTEDAVSSLYCQQMKLYFFTKHCILRTKLINMINSQYMCSVCGILNLITSDPVKEWKRSSVAKLLRT